MNLARKQFRDIRRGRVSARAEIRKQQVLRNNLEKLAYRRLNTLLRKFVRTRAYLYKEFGVYDANQSRIALDEELIPTMTRHYRRVFKAIFANANELYDKGTKADEVFILGRSVDFERLVESYFAGRALTLSGISTRMANRIDKIIRDGRADNLTLAQISKSISDKVMPITRARAATIARTETHNAASFANHSYHGTVANDLGMEMVKQWVSIGGTPMGYAGDPKGGAKNVINCRCVIIYTDAQDVVSN